MSSLIFQVIPSTAASHSLWTWQVGGGQVVGGRINTNTKPRDKYYNYCLLDGRRINTNTKPRDKYYCLPQRRQGARPTVKQSSHTRVENMLNSLLSTCDRKIVTSRLIHKLNDALFQR